MKTITLILSICIVIALIVIAGVVVYLVLKADNIIVKPECGNNVCGANENWKNCPKDCEKSLKGFCGDKVCESKEAGVCVQDCPKKPVCGDGICSLNENCEEDCEELPPVELPPQIGCGDGSCNSGETCLSCSADCGSCPPQQSGGSHFGMAGASIFKDELKEAGVEITREWIKWDKIEPTNDNYDWAEMDATVQAMNNAGIEILGYFIGMPVWARDSSDPKCGVAGGKMGDICTPKDWADYEEFVKNVAERYDGKHGHGEMKYIGVWNEVQLFSQMTAAEYTPWLTKGYTAIKQGNQDAQVSIGSLLDPFEFPNSGEFIDTMFRNYSQYFDITDFHVYRKEIGVSETSRDIKERMNNYNINKSMWITETATNLATLPFNLDWYDDIAIDVAKRYTRAFSEGVDKIFWFGFVSTPTKQEDPMGIECGGQHYFNMGGLGWSLKGTAAYHPRLAYTAYKTMTSKLNDFSSVNKITDTQYKFRVNNKNVYVLWGSGNIPSEITGTVKVTDYLGNEQTMDASQIVLTDSPIFVEGSTEIPSSITNITTFEVIQSGSDLSVYVSATDGVGIEKINLNSPITDEYL